MKLVIQLMMDANRLKELGEILETFDFDNAVTDIRVVPSETGAVDMQNRLNAALAFHPGAAARPEARQRFKVLRENVIAIKEMRRKYPKCLKKDVAKAVQMELGYNIANTTVYHILRGGYDKLLDPKKDAEWFSVTEDGKRRFE